MMTLYIKPHRSPFFFLIVLVFLYSDLSGQTEKPAGTFEQPRLVVGIVIDQMRADYIYRYWDNLTQDGFRRLISEGFNCSNVHYNYVPTYTGPGHASIYTGTTPAVHGIIGNGWYTEKAGKVYCAGDSLVSGIGATDANTRMSPHRMLTTTVGDELRLFSNFRSKVTGISLKDRGAIFPAGHSGNAYWFNNVSNSFITSSYYKMKDLPLWLKRFNDRNLADKFLNSIWKPLYNVERYKQSTPDNTLYENLLDAAPEAQPVFDYNLKKIRISDPDLLRKTPFGNTIIKELAIAAIEGELLGNDTVCDMLLISFSSTDYIGHIFGTNAIETEDTYLRLDKDLAELFTYLDQSVGKDNYLLFVTADHAAMPNPVFMKDNNIPGGFIYNDSIESYLKNFIVNRYKNSALIEYYMNDQIWLNEAAVKSAAIDRTRLLKELCDELLKLEYVADALTCDELLNVEYSWGMRAKAQRGYNRKRSGDIAIIYQPGYIESYGAKRPHAGTTHGSPYRYDTHVPLFWMGWNIRTGHTSREIMITDIAPTLSVMLNICQPSGSIGHPITEITDR